MPKCNHKYRPSMRGGYACQLCEKDIDSETYDEVTALIAERDELKAENDHWRKVTSTDMHIEQLHYENGNLNLSATHPLGEAVIASLASIFASGGGKNYLELHVHHREVGPLAVILQRMEGKNPAQRVQQLQTEHFIVATKLASIEAAIRDYHYALDTRQHGQIAANKAFCTIQTAVGMPTWTPGAEKARREQEA